MTLHTVQKLGSCHYNLFTPKPGKYEWDTLSFLFKVRTKYMLGTKYSHNCSKLVFFTHAISSGIHLSFCIKFEKSLPTNSPRDFSRYYLWPWKHHLIFLQLFPPPENGIPASRFLRGLNGLLYLRHSEQKVPLKCLINAHYSYYSQWLMVEPPYLTLFQKRFKVVFGTQDIKDKQLPSCSYFITSNLNHWLFFTSPWHLLNLSKNVSTRPWVQLLLLAAC